MDDISRILPRTPGKRDSIAKFLAAGFPVETVIDVGVQYGTPELIDTLGDRRHILCEPIVEYHDSIRRTYTARGVDFLLDARAASDSDGTAQIALSTTSDASTITHARLNDADAPGQTLRAVETVTLATLVEDRNLAGPFLLKIDVDGAEEMILKGAAPILSQCSGVVMEAHVESFSRGVSTLWMLASRSSTSSICAITTTGCVRWTCFSSTRPLHPTGRKSRSAAPGTIRSGST